MTSPHRNADVELILGMCAQTVHERLVRLGANIPKNVLSENDKQRIRDLFLSGFRTGDGKLDALCRELNRTKSFISRFAKSEGLTNARRKADASFIELQRRRAVEQIKTHGHPRGALGLKHSDHTKRVIGFRSAMRAASRTPEERSALIHKSMRTRLKKYGNLGRERAAASWKQGWREIDGKRIYFRSRWEFNYAIYLQFLVEQKQIRSWEHEPETFWFEGIRRGCVSYLPDYRVTLTNGEVEYHEVKGWMDARSKTKIRRMKKYHPSVKLRVIDSKWFKTNGPKLSFLPGWEK